MIIYGASGHAMVIYSIIEELNISLSCVIDDNPNLNNFLGQRVTNIYKPNIIKNKKIIIAIGNNYHRKKVSLKIAHKFETLISPRSVVNKFSKIQEGSVVVAGSIIQFGSKIGKHVILNTGCSVDHHCIINDYVHLSPGTRLGGNVIIGEGTHVGINATVLPNIIIGKWCTVGAGAVVIKNVPDFAVVVGNPARIVKFNPTNDL